MIGRITIVPLVLVLLSLSISFTVCCASHTETASFNQPSSKPVVVTTTSVLASIVKDLAGDLVVVEVVASPALCPAHYDVKPSDVEKFKHASLILYHGFEPWIKELVEASGTKAPLVRVSGPWNTPDNLKKLYVKVAEALKKYLGLDIDERLKKCLEGIDRVAEWLKKFAEDHGFRDVPVVVVLWQKPFVSYLGFRIVAIYKPPEKVSVAELRAIIENATKNHAVLVIDNLQSGTDLGRKIAEEVGAVEVALTNFPWTAPEIVNVTEMMKYNAKLLAQALKTVGLELKYYNVSSALEKLQHDVSKLRQELNAAKNEVTTWRYAFLASLVANVVLVALLVIIFIRMKRV